MKNFARMTMLLLAAAFCIAGGAAGANAGTGGGGEVSLNAPFDPEVRSYSATVPHEVTEITVVAQARDPSVTVTVNGGDPATPVPLAVGENSIEVVVTAEDGQSWLTYTVTVTRAAAGAVVVANPHAGLIAKVREWRDDPRYVHHKPHTDRWDRVLLALGEMVSDGSLTAMGASEAQGYADRGWTRWVEVAAALRQIENGGTQSPVPVPAVSVAAGAAVTEGAPASFTLTASPAPAADLGVSVEVSQNSAFADPAALGARTVTIPAGQTSATFAVATVDDGTDEADGAVTAALAAGTGYTVSSSQGTATVAVTDNDEALPAVSIAAGAPATEGRNAGFTLTAAPAPAADLGVSVTVSQSGDYAGPGALGARTVTIPAGQASASFSVATVDDALDEPDGSVTATLAAGAGYTLGDAARATVAVADDDEPPPAIVTKRTIAREGADDAAVFTVRLDRAPAQTVTVDYATADGGHRWAGTAPATAGADYTATSGTLAFAAGETLRTVSVPILDDVIDEGTEYFLLRFSNPRGATLAAGHRETQGLIRNSDPLQKMWLSRFGRTVGTQVTDAVSGRLEGGLAPGAHATLAGQSLDLSNVDDGQTLTDALTGLARAFGAPGAPAAADGDPFAWPGLSGTWDDPATASAPARSMTGRELLSGSGFHAAWAGDGSGPGLAAWGRVATGRFDGEEASDGGPVRVDGEWVVTVTLGADAEWDRVLAGVAVSQSEGEGTFHPPGPDAGSIGTNSNLTTVSPYARVHLTNRIAAWGLAGFGTGDLTIAFADGRMDPVRTDTSMRMAAAGVRGALLEPGPGGGWDLALKAEGFAVRLESDRAVNSAATTADASRVRLVLDGGRAFTVSETATLRPSLEVGLRHDGGDAETGTGVEIGGSVAWSDAASGLSVEARARLLVAHADSDYREWGASAVARLDPGADGRGLAFSLSPTVGATSSAAERLWGAHDARALAPAGTFEAARGLQAEAGYGFALAGGRFTGTPNVGFGSADGARDWRIGWRLAPVGPGGGFAVNLDALRREAANGDGPEHGVMLRSSIRW